MLVVLSFTLNWWNKSSRIIAPTMLVSLLFGILDAIKTTGFTAALPALSQHLPLADQGLAWLPPSLVMLLIVALVDRLKGAEQVSVHS